MIYYNTQNPVVKGPEIIVNKVTTLVVILSIGLLVSVGEAKPPTAPQTPDSTYTATDNASGWEEAVKEINAGAGEHQQIEERNKTPDITPAERQANAARQGAIVEQLDRNATRFPDNPVVQGAAAGAALRVNQPKKAQIYAQRWESLAEPDSPEWAKAVNTGGLAAQKAGDFKKAEAAALRVLDKFPKDKDALSLYHASKGRGQAVAAPAAPAAAPAPVFARAPAPAAPFVSTPVAPNVKSYLDRAASLIGMRDFRGALDAAQRASAIEPSNPDPHMQQAVAWAALKNVSEAMLAVSRAIERLAEGDPRQPSAYTTRALLKNKAGDYVGAAADAGAAIDRDPVFADAYYQRSLARKGLGNKAESLADVRRAAELKPSDYKHLFDVAAGEMAESGAAAPVARRSAFRDVWTKLLDSAGGGFRLFVGAMGALFVLFAGWVFFFAKESSRVRSFFTRSGGTPAATTPAREPAMPKSLDNGRYVIGQMLGEGGMGIVHEAEDTQLGRRVAVKSLRDCLRFSVGECLRFVGEAKAVASLQHPHIVQVFTIIEEQANTYIVYELIEGCTLHDVIRRGQAGLESRVALEYVRQTASALDHAHDNKVLHRDMKPSNVMVTRVNGKDWLKVMDFGIARQIDSSRVTMTGTIVGTPVYMAPEQEDGVVTKHSDQFSLGVAAYELLTLRLPFSGMAAHHDKRTAAFVRPSLAMPGLPPEIDAVFEKVLHPNHEKRYARCMEFCQALEVALHKTPTPK